MRRSGSGREGRLLVERDSICRDLACTRITGLRPVRRALADSQEFDVFKERTELRSPMTKDAAAASEFTSSGISLRSVRFARITRHEEKEKRGGRHIKGYSSQMDIGARLWTMRQYAEFGHCRGNQPEV